MTKEEIGELLTKAEKIFAEEANLITNRLGRSLLIKAFSRVSAGILYCVAQNVSVSGISANRFESVCITFRALSPRPKGSQRSIS